MICSFANTDCMLSKSTSANVPTAAAWQNCSASLQLSLCGVLYVINAASQLLVSRDKGGGGGGMYLVSWAFLQGEGYQASLPSASSSNQPTFQDLSRVLGSFLYCSHPSLKIATNSLFTCAHHTTLDRGGHIVNASLVPWFCTSRNKPLSSLLSPEARFVRIKQDTSLVNGNDHC